MKFRFFLLFALCASVLNASALDREAFTFTNYDLNVRLDPEQQRLGVRGTITLRNDSPTPQTMAVLQISSSLGWRSITVRGKQVQFVAQSYTSDIDHTGALSEAIVTLPAPVPPKGTIDLEIAYEGVVVLDATRLTRIDTPESAAISSDWDQISAKFTAVRGVGYVAWYPIATESANLSNGKNLDEVLSRWKTREAVSSMHVRMAVPGNDEDTPELLVNATTCPLAQEERKQFVADCSYRSSGFVVPTFVIANYETLDRSGITVHYLRGRDSAATIYANSAEKVLPLIKDWFGAAKSKAQTADLLDPDAATFESGSLLLMPLTGSDPKLAGLMAAHQLTHAAFFSPRPWINEGLAHFSQALYLEQQSGRQAAIEYMKTHRAGFIGNENQTVAPSSEDEVNRSLVNTADEELYRSKAMCVWWMLRDMLGDTVLKKALASYHSQDDKEPSYMQRLIQAQTQRDLKWFFDDWVYRDHGLPDFKVVSAFTRRTLPEGFMLTVTVQNLGAAGAEVPLTVKFAGGEVSKRLEVRAKSNGVIRIETPAAPQEVVVNDGSVPEKRTDNNVFELTAGDIAQ